LIFCLFFYQENCAAINEAKNYKQQQVKSEGGLGANPKGE
jgi:hypothetical protein